MEQQTRVALVTGAGSGIGRACALAFARAGASVVVADIAAEGGREIVGQIEAAGGTATFVAADVTDAAQVERLVQAAVETYGRLDWAHNNAGVAQRQHALTADCPEEEWDRVMAVNLKGVWLCMKFEIPQMLRQGSGAIVNTASTAGLVGLPNSSIYTASKHGVVGLTRSAAVEYARHGVRINAVCPGTVLTPMVEALYQGNREEIARRVGSRPTPRAGTPEEVAAAVVWLCSDAASFVTGHTLAVDGGFVAQ